MRQPRRTGTHSRPPDASRTDEELEKRLFHLKTLYEISREISTAGDMRSIGNTLLMMVMGTLGVERGVLALFDMPEPRVTLCIHRGGEDDVGPILADAAASGTIAGLCGSADDVVYEHADGSGILAALGLRVWIPCAVNGSLVGGLGLGPKLTEEPYTDDDGELLTTLVNQAAIALRNAAAHEQIVRYANELAATLRRVQTLESMKMNLAKFVPRAVQALIEASPDAPLFDKHESDVSVLFADITGYTRLSAQLELERINQLVEVYFGAFLDEIVRHGGDVNETAGDGLMVIFQDSDPSAHAAAAVRAGLAIQRRTEEINGTLEGFFEPIQMHVGVNSGVAAVGVTKIEGAAGVRWTYTASGSTTNLASRLAGLGGGGHVLASDETRRRLGPEFLAEDMGLQLLKNVAQPVRAFRVTLSGQEMPRGGELFAERRRHPRRPVAWPARLWLGDQWIDVAVVNASLYGLCVAANSSDAGELLEPGKAYRLELYAGAEVPFSCSVAIRHIGGRGYGMEAADPCPLG
jgi:class 3 adenylate cyclase